MVKEIWLPVVGYEGYYEASSLGRIRTIGRSCLGLNNKERLVPERIKDQTITDKGYFKIILSVNKIKTKPYVHRVIAKAFIPNPENKPFINHKNGIKTDNRVENLEWCTPKENAQHALKSGLIRIRKGEESGYYKLTNDKVMAIFNSNKTTYEIEKEFGISQATVSVIKRGAGWSHITGKVYARQRITEEDVKNIRSLMSEGKYDYKTLSTKFNITMDHLKNIVSRKLWKNVV